ncbi:sigma-70 family RNA polymerase sigma factor [Aureivirga sp. CE67]|uniref:sigma-70 family RNA polymerase sigma factor n=1 Tax=Aureivirga sp. CE67 TaxID=1788983 RepID=UPI0018C97BF8|nr:sigma-70 family RNA polymerase sigma factor [Aureivirga sp. CE67]
MSNKTHSIIESNFRASYGKLFSALISQFGVGFTSEIEDAIQNTFLKSLKSWNTSKIPDHKENWLFIVARNDMINQIRKKKKTSEEVVLIEEIETEISSEDLRLQTILFLASSTKISTQSKVLFTLKNIFGLHIREISEATLLNQDAIYKNLKRAKRKLKLEFEAQDISVLVQKTSQEEINIVEEILYAVFNIGFDSFDEKQKTIINEDLCLEALSLAKILYEKHQLNSTKNLLALFCFHIARIPAKIENGKLISFFKQKRENWNKEMIQLGFHYLEKPENLNKFYMETLIISKYMMVKDFSQSHWNTIVNLYEILLKLSNSPIIKLNYCYCLNKADKTEQALEILEEIENDFPSRHVYFSLVKANILRKKNPKKAENILASIVEKMNQNIRKEYLLENSFIDL